MVTHLDSKSNHTGTNFALLSVISYRKIHVGTTVKIIDIKATKYSGMVYKNTIISMRNRMINRRFFVYKSFRLDILKLD